MTERTVSVPNLKAWLRITGIRQEDFAKELGISQSFVSALVNRQKNPSAELLVKLAGRTGLPLNSLLAGQ